MDGANRHDVQSVLGMGGIANLLGMGGTANLLGTKTDGIANLLGIKTDGIANLLGTDGVRNLLKSQLRSL